MYNFGHWSKTTNLYHNYYEIKTLGIKITFFMSKSSCIFWFFSISRILISRTTLVNEKFYLLLFLKYIIYKNWAHFMTAPSINLIFHQQPILLLLALNEKPEIQILDGFELSGQLPWNHLATRNHCQVIFQILDLYPTDWLGLSNFRMIPTIWCRLVLVGKKHFYLDLVLYSRQFF